MDKKRIATLFLIVLMDTAGATAIVLLIPIYVLAQFHATPFQAGLLLAAYYTAQVLAAPWLGKLSDRFGRRPILLVSQAGTIVSYLLIVFAIPLGALLDHAGLPLGVAGGLIVIFLARILDGVTGGNVSVALAVVGSVGIIRHKPAHEAAQSQGSLVETTVDMVTIGSESGLST